MFTIMDGATGMIEWEDTKWKPRIEYWENPLLKVQPTTT